MRVTVPSTRTVIVLAAITGLVAAVADGIVNAANFKHESILDALFKPSLFEIYIRSALFLLFLGFGFVVSRLLAARRKAEKALIESEEKFRNLAEQSPNMIFINKAGRIVYVNPRCESTMGYKKEEFYAPGFDFLTLVAPEDREPVMANFKRHSLGEEIPPYDYGLVTKDGARIEGILTTRLVDYEGDKAILGIITDITERKRMEESLLQSEEKLRRMFESVAEGVVAVDLKGVIVEVNQKMLDMHGYSSREKMIGKPLSEFIPPPSRQMVQLTRQRTLEEGRIEKVEGIGLRSDGSTFSVEVNASVLKDASGRIVGTIAAIHDVTDRKQAEKALRQSEESFRSLVENIPLGISITSLDGQYSLVNSAFLKMRGYDSAEEVKSQPISRRYYDPKDRERWLALLRENGRVESFEVRLKRKDRSVFWASVTSIPQTTASGEQRFISVSQDITERKRTEEALRESEERLKAVVMNAPIGIVTAGADKIFLTANEAYCRILGYSEAELQTKSFKDITYPEDTGESISLMKDFDAGKIPSISVEKRYVRKDGRVITGEVTINALRSNDGKPYLYIAELVDITERKQSAEQLKESEEKFSKLFRSIPDAVALTTLDGRLVEVNESLLRLSGYARDEMIGKTTVEMGFWPDSAGRQTFIETLQKNGRVADMEIESRHKSGSFKSVRISAETIELRGNEYLLVVIRDVTDRKRAEDALKKAEQNFRNSMDESPLGIRVITLDGDLLYANRAILDMYGYGSIEELKATPTGERYTPESYLEYEKRRELRKRGEFVPANYEISIIRKDGEIRNLSVSRKNVTWDGVTQIQVIYQDVTGIKRMQEQLMVQDRLASIGQLVSGVAHELNNPLTSVIGFSDILLARELPDNVRNDLSIVNDEALRAASIVKNLLTFARKQSLEKQPVDIDESIRRVLELRAYEQTASNIQVNAGFGNDLPKILANSSQLQQVFMNIVINAKFFMLEAHGKGNLTITTNQAGDFLRVSFADDGPGISRENMRRLFNPFFTTKDVGKGTGLGLSICQGIVAEHGGKMWAESEPGKGAARVL